MGSRYEDLLSGESPGCCSVIDRKFDIPEDAKSLDFVLSSRASSQSVPVIVKKYSGRDYDLRFKGDDVSSFAKLLILNKAPAGAITQVFKPKKGVKFTAHLTVEYN